MSQPLISSMQAYAHFALEVTNLASRRGAIPLFSKFSFQLLGGHLLWLRGANGIGKSTLLRILAGLTRPQAGHIKLCYDQQDLPTSALIHYIAHKPALTHGLSVKSNLELWANILSSPPQAVTRALDDFALRSFMNIDCAYLSSGQTRRATLARLALSARPLWLLDEPFVGLDQPSIESLLAQISAHLKAGGAAIIVSHQTFELRGYQAMIVDLADYQANANTFVADHESWQL